MPICSIEWHLACLKNTRAYLENKEKILAALCKEIDDTRSDIAFYARQIDEATERKLPAFNRDRFMKPRKTLPGDPERRPTKGPQAV